MISRNADSALKAIRDIKDSQAKTVAAIPDVTFIECDLGDLKHVRRVADRIREQEPRLDLVRSCPAGF